MGELFAPVRDKARRAVEPLPLRMRPRTLDEFAGQEHILGEGKLLRRMLQADVITSLILHGPPGTGKTTLAELIAHHSRRHFVRENAASVGVKRIREIIDLATGRLESTGHRTILFLDEIHRFTRSQQDVLLSDVERGLITLVGATTENPLFAVNSALVSRSTLFRLELLTPEQIKRIVRAAVADPERGYGKLDLTVTDEALEVWAIKSDGDARRALTALEVAVLSSQRTAGAAQALVINRAAAEDSIQQKAAVYDGTGDEHYDSISAMIKSVRGSDPDAAVYWVARMLEAGEDPRYVARRLAILASEDIGNADPRGIMVAQAAWDLVERIGMPEAQITLAQCATYLALAPKSNASYVAIAEAMGDVKEGRTLPVPIYLRDNSSPLAGQSGAGERVKELGGESYRYSHDAPGAITDQDYLGVDKTYYRPTPYGAEKAMGERLEQLRRLRGIGRHRESPLDDRKAGIRRDLRRAIAAIDDRDRRSALIVGQLLEWDRFRAARTVMAFQPLMDEPDIGEAGTALLARGGRLFWPRVDWSAGVMQPCEVADHGRGLVRGRGGLSELPEAAPTIKVAELDLILVPAMGFDVSGGRIGRGAGFYDRFLAPIADRLGRVSKACGVGFDAQVVEEVPMGPMDIRLGAVATETRLILT